MKLLIQNAKVVGTATDEYNGPEQFITAPADFDLSRMGEYQLVNGALTQLSPAQWLIDIGPFFDRFGAAKMPLLMSTDPTVQALVKDLQVRKWIDLKRPDVGQGIDALMAIGIAGVTAELKDSILNTPPSSDDNFALRRVYFQG